MERDSCGEYIHGRSVLGSVHFSKMEHYMKECMGDSAHDKEHIYRVLYTALEIADTEPNVDRNVLVAACLLHDIGREEQFRDPTLCHAAVGAEKAHAFLLGSGFDARFAEDVCRCILTHRYRKETPPESIEAKILFDADKIDVAGLVGIARTLLYKGQVSEPLYVEHEGEVSKGTVSGEVSFFQEYKYKLENIYGRFFTRRGAEIAATRRHSAEVFYNSLYEEVTEFYQSGRERLAALLETGETAK